MGRSFEKLFLLSTIAATGGATFLVQSSSEVQAAGPAYSWTRCYVGAQAGAATSTSRWAYTNSNPFSSTDNLDPQLVPGANFNDNRGVIGLQAGCNRAIADQWLVGIEGAGFSNPMNSRNNNSGFTPFPSNFGFNEFVTTNIQSVLSATGRLGFAPTPDWLFYGKGGYAAARIETSGTFSPSDFNDPTLGDFSSTAWHSGWTAGAGLEYRLFKNVTIGAEYNYYRFANVSRSAAEALPDLENGVPTPSNPVNHRVNADVQTLMARVNFALPSGDGTDPLAAYAAYVKAPPLAPPVNPWSAFTSSEVRYSTWTGTRGTNVFVADQGRGSGYQVYSPTTIGIDYNSPSEYKLETRFKGGYVYTSQNTAGQIARYEGPVDTQVSFNLTLQNFDTIQPLFGLALNLPTGNSYLPGNQRFTRMDPDLVDVGSYGVGFNVNPTAGFIIGLNQTTAVSFSAGYTWQGDFTREGIFQVGEPNPRGPGVTPDSVVLEAFDLPQRIHPGDAFTANGNISSKLGKLSLMSSFAYIGSTRASIDGLASGRTGANFTANGAANYQIDDRWALATNVSWSFTQKNEVPDGLGSLFVEPKDSNSNMVIGSIEPSYMVTDRLRLAANYSFLYRDHNFYDQLQEQFIAAKQKHLVGASLTYAATSTSIITVRGSHAWVRQDDGPLVPAENQVLALEPPALKYEVWAASIGANISF